MSDTSLAVLVALGLFAGAYGTLIGAGGGFILVPILLFLYPHTRPVIITSVSLAAVFFNALSGTFAYARMRRIDYRSGAMFAAAAIPGAIAGSLTVSLFSREVFNIVFAVLLIALSLYIFVRPIEESTQRSQQLTIHKGYVLRRIKDADGHEYTYTYPVAWAVLFAAGVGFLSNLLGIGGGIIHVPALITVFTFPAHIATATSHFILVITSFTGTVTHILVGDYNRGLRRTIALAIGVLIGAQVGARSSNAVRSTLILRLLAVALLLAGIRLLWSGIAGG